MITGVVLARNEENNIVECLESLRPHVAEIILIDMESTDGTVELARPFVSKVLTHPLVPNFDAARNIAIPEAKHDWLWFLDADERVPDQTGQLIQQIIRDRGIEAVAITIPFKTYFCGHWMQHCGWWPGYTMPRVLKRGHFRFSEKLHSGVEFDGPAIRLAADPTLAIDHFSYRSIEHYVDKFNRYTSTEAGYLADRGASPNWEHGIRELVRDLWLYYERNEGIRDGYFGWILAWLAGQYRWFAQAKLADIAGLKETAATAVVPQNLDQVLSVMRHELGRLRTTSSPRPFGLVIRSPLFDPSGYAEDGRMLLKAAAHGSRAVTAVEIPWSDSPCRLPDSDTALYRALLRGSPPTNAMSLTNCIPTLCLPDPETNFNVLRTLFETDRIPEFWLPHIEPFDEVWVAARHNAEAFRRSGVAPERIRILPEFVDTTLFSPIGKRLNLPKFLTNRFVFLSVFDWQQRKGWDLLLRAFCEEFSAGDRVGLLLKITKVHGYSMEQIRAQIDSLLRPLGKGLDDRPEICLWDATLDQCEMAELYRSVDAFVLASRGEGWGRPYMEAMATCLPTIGTAGSGNQDFMNENNSFLVETTLVEVPEQAANEIHVYRGHLWQEPQPASLRKAMRAAHRDKRRATAIAKRARKDMEERYSLEVGTKVLNSLVEDVERRLMTLQPPAVQAGQLLVHLEGEFFAGHSFSNINEQLALNWLLDDQIAVSLQRVYHNPAQDGRIAHAYRLRPYLERPFDRPVDVTIRHAFPPNWLPPQNGKWVHIQPWEYGYLPRDWIRPLRDLVDEIWAPSNYVKNVYVRSGIPEQKIVVIPWGVDPDVYRPDVPRLHLPSAAAFKFLFVGGSVLRKGIDVLLRAYLEEFADEKNVSLVIKDLGTSTFYRYGNYRQQIMDATSQPDAPHILYIDREMTDGQRASLYSACDCLVAPYRGEGFGLPVLEGMACGLAPIVPAGGATDDFVSTDEGYFVPATVVECDHEWRLVGPATELHIDVAELRRVMRQAFEDKSLTRAKGQAAFEKVRSRFTWRITSELMTQRLQVVSERCALQLCAPILSPQTIDASILTGDVKQSALEAVSPLFSTINPEKNVHNLFGGSRLDLTVCVVTRNQERVIADCLARVQPFVREIVVVDLDSCDRTPAIAQEYGARVFQLPWSDCYSAARNFALRRATSEWILRLDPVERVDETAIQALAMQLADPGPVAGFSVHCLAASGDNGEIDIRVFRNHSEIQYEGRALERVTSSLRRLGGAVVETGVTIRRTLPENGEGFDVLKLIHQDVADRPDDPEGLFRLGAAHAKFGNYFHAECYLQNFLSRVDAQHPDYVFCMQQLINIYRKIDDPLRAQEWESKLRGNGKAGGR